MWTRVKNARSRSQSASLVCRLSLRYWDGSSLHGMWLSLEVFPYKIGRWICSKCGCFAFSYFQPTSTCFNISDVISRTHGVWVQFVFFRAAESRFVSASVRLNFCLLHFGYRFFMILSTFVSLWMKNHETETIHTIMLFAVFFVFLSLFCCGTSYHWRCWTVNIFGSSVPPGTKKWKRIPTVKKRWRAYVSCPSWNVT